MRKVLSLLTVLFVALTVACGEKPAPPPAPTPVPEPTMAPVPSPVPPTPIPPKPTPGTSKVCHQLNVHPPTGADYQGSCGITDTCHSTTAANRFVGDPCYDPAK